MSGSIAVKYALRNLGRHRRRTLLSMIGVGIGVAIALIASSWIRGGAEMQIRAIAESGSGHLRIVPQGWSAEHETTLRLPRSEEIEAIVRLWPAVKIAAPRARIHGILAFGTRSIGVEIMGVRPELEARTNRIVFKGAISGRYLQTGDRGRVVIGRTVAERLRIGLDDDIYVTFAGVDGVRSAMLRIVGILDTGVRELDATICHVCLEELEELSGYRGPGDIIVLLHDFRRIDPTRRALARHLPDVEVLSWKEVNPGLAAGIDGDRAFMHGLVAIIIVVVGLGIVNAQLTAVMERRREIAVLTALGMKARQVIGMVVVEACAIALGGAAVALALGGSAAYRLATRGVDLRIFMGEDIAFGDVLLDPYIYGDFGPWLLGRGLAIALAATLTASLYPAWIAARVEPAEALRL